MGMLISPRFRTDGKRETQRREEGMKRLAIIITSACRSVHLWGVICVGLLVEEGGMSAFPLSCFVFMLGADGR